MARHRGNLVRVIVLLTLGCVGVIGLNAQIVYPLPGLRGDSAVVGDFNHDGIPDVAAVTRCESSLRRCGQGRVAFYWGDGAGNFTLGNIIEPEAKINGPAVAADFYGDGGLEVIIPTWGHGLAIVGWSYSFFKVDGRPTGVQFADLDGDGKLDILLSNGSLDVYRGSGGGSYTKIGSYPGADGNLLLADFNGDGKVDAAATDAAGINVFLGNGDGTFQPALHTDGLFTSISAADFNRDGKLDLIAGTSETSLVTVLLGNGHGTFVAQPSYNTAQWHSAAVVTGDFNKDGNLDVAVADGCWTPGWPCVSNGAVTIMLGNGDGTLQLPASYDAGGRVVIGKWHQHRMFITSSDLDRNGDTDLITVNQVCPDYPNRQRPRDCAGTFAVLFGNGDGTFQSASVNNHYVSSTFLTASLNPSIYGQPVTFTATVTSAGPDVPTGTVLFQVPQIGRHWATLTHGVATFTTAAMIADSVDVTAAYRGDNSQLASKSVAYVQTVNPAATTTQITSSRNPSQLGQTVAFTVTVTSAFVTPRGTVTFKIGDDVVATVALVKGHALYRTAALPVGSATINATFNPELNRVGGTNFITSSGSIVQVVQ